MCRKKIPQKVEKKFVEEAHLCNKVIKVVLYLGDVQIKCLKP